MTILVTGGSKGLGYNIVKSLSKNKNNVGFKWLHDNFGTNFRLTELQSAIGRLSLIHI